MASRQWHDLKKGKKIQVFRKVSRWGSDNTCSRSMNGRLDQDGNLENSVGKDAGQKSKFTEDHDNEFFSSYKHRFP